MKRDGRARPGPAARLSGRCAAGSRQPRALDRRSRSASTGDAGRNLYADDVSSSIPRIRSSVSRLTIKLGANSDQVRFLTIQSPSAGALQWLEPSLTAGKSHPFLFTQSQAIQARTWVPLQDSPGVRVTYAANIFTFQPGSRCGDGGQGVTAFARRMRSKGCFTL